MLLNSLWSTTLVTKGFVHEKITFQDIILPENQRDDAPKMRASECKAIISSVVF